MPARQGQYTLPPRWCRSAVRTPSPGLLETEGLGYPAGFSDVGLTLFNTGQYSKSGP